MATALEFLTEFSKDMKLDAAAVIGNLSEYQAKMGFWSKPIIWESSHHTTPLIWWKGLCKTQCISQVASKIFAIVPTSAASERIWSAFGLTHTVKRNRLTNTRVSKLVAIRSCLLLGERKNIKKTGFTELHSSSEDSSSEMEEEGDITI